MGVRRSVAGGAGGLGLPGSAVTSSRPSSSRCLGRLACSRGSGSSPVFRGH